MATDIDYCHEGELLYMAEIDSLYRMVLLMQQSMAVGDSVKSILQLSGIYKDADNASLRLLIDHKEKEIRWLKGVTRFLLGFATAMTVVVTVR